MDLIFYLENEIDGTALKQILSEENNCSLKELIPKVGPRLRTLHVLKQEYGGNATKENPKSESRIHEKNPYKGRLKLNMSGGEWDLEKLNEKVCGNKFIGIAQAYRVLWSSHI